jgi:xylulokinase
VLVPYFDGERTPNRPDATGALLGLRSDVSREHVARAAVEGVICGLLDGLDALGLAGVETHRGRLLLLGGGARSAAYRQVLADLSGRPVTVPEYGEHVATGACLQAAAVATGGTVEDLTEAWGVGRGAVVDPRGGVDTGAIRDAYHQASTRLYDS